MFTAIPLYPPSCVMYTLDRGDTMQGLLIITKVNKKFLCRNILECLHSSGIQHKALEIVVTNIAVI